MERAAVRVSMHGIGACEEDLSGPVALWYVTNNTLMLS